MLHHQLEHRFHRKLCTINQWMTMKMNACSILQRRLAACWWIIVNKCIIVNRLIVVKKQVIEHQYVTMRHIKQ